jgi:hypothetical protein
MVLRKAGLCKLKAHLLDCPRLPYDGRGGTLASDSDAVTVRGHGSSSGCGCDARHGWVERPVAPIHAAVGRNEPRNLWTRNELSDLLDMTTKGTGI